MFDVVSADSLRDSVGQTRSCPLQLRISPEKLKAFLKISENEQVIHRLEGEEKATLPANLLLSVIPSMLQSGLEVQYFDHGHTAAYRDVRFIQTVNCGQELRLSYTISAVRRRADNFFVELQLEMTDAQTGEPLMTLVQTDRYHYTRA